MDMFFHKVTNRLVAVFLSVVFSISAQAFELLSEGAMGSVSAVSANSAEEIVNVAGASAAGLTDDGYESLPFQAETRVASSQTNEVSVDLEFSLTQEVESWANNLREGDEGVSVEVGFVDELPPSIFENPGFVVPQTVIEEIVIAPVGSDEEDETVYQLGRIEQTVTIIEQGVNNVTYEVARYVERAATIDARPFHNEPSMGSGYISDLTSFSHISIAAVRD